MSDSNELSKTEKLELLTKDIKKDWKKSRVKHAGRFVVSKNKQMQLDDGAIGNVYVLSDIADDLKYTISVNASVEQISTPTCQEEVRNMDSVDLANLQRAFTQFLKTIHEEL